jgi:sugar phosphate permease
MGGRGGGSAHLCGAELVGPDSVGASEGFLGWIAYLGECFGCVCVWGGGVSVHMCEWRQGREPGHFVTLHSCGGI